MKRIASIITAGLVGAGIASLVWIATTKQKDNTQLTGPIQYTCELSGGTFENGACVCPVEEDMKEINKYNCENTDTCLSEEEVQNLAYDKTTGFCQSTIGGPGGDAFEASIGLPYGYYAFWNSIIFGLCEQSGGQTSGAACICPSEPVLAGSPAYTYDKETGLCTDSFGIPSGELGEEAKKLQEYQMLKNKQ